jgi:hypothetical protein
MTTEASAAPAAKFKDRVGREWEISLDYATLERVKIEQGVDLGDAARIAEVWARLLYDDPKTIAVAWLAVEAAATANGVDRAAFIAAMDGNAVEAVIAALETALVSFTSPRKRGMVQTAIAGIRNGMAQAVAKAEEYLATGLEDATERALAAHGTSPTALPAFLATSTNAGPQAGP